MVSVAIFDYGAGNIFSLKNSLEQAGASVDVSLLLINPIFILDYYYLVWVILILQ